MEIVITQSRIVSGILQERGQGVICISETGLGNEMARRRFRSGQASRLPTGV